MSHSLIGITHPDNSYSARPLQSSTDPDHVVAILRRLRDDADDWESVVIEVLAHPWADLDTAARKDPHDPAAVTGIGHTAADDTSARVNGRVSDPVGHDLDWLYLIDNATDTVVVYEATRHDRWLLHSRHRLDHGDDDRRASAPPPSAGMLTRQTAAPLTHLSTSASDRYVEDLTNGIRRGSIVLDPPYQRGSVWSTDQRVALMRSWLMGVPVAAITLNNRMGAAWHATDPHARIAYAVVDGKQRLNTALAWEDGNLAIPASWLPADWIETIEDTDDGPYVRRAGLTVAGMRHVRSQMTLPCVQAHLPNVEAEAELYLLVNGAGTPQSSTDMTNAARVAGH